MEEELSRQFSKLATDGEPRNDHQESELEDGHNNNHEFHEDMSGNCNLIVNYLPHDIDDSALRVSSLYS